MYDYRKMTPVQRREAVEYWRLRERPWHSPPHWEFRGLLQFMISSACYEHHHIIGVTPERMTECESALLDVCDRFATSIYAWCLLPNHYSSQSSASSLCKAMAGLAVVQRCGFYRTCGPRDCFEDLA